VVKDEVGNFFGLFLVVSFASAVIDAVGYVYHFYAEAVVFGFGCWESD
jgi:hypothetical protein